MNKALLVATCFIISTTVLLSSFCLMNSDVWLHMAAGQLALEQGFTHQDNFTFTHAGSLYLPQDPIAQILYYWIWQVIDGPTLLILLKIILLTITFILVLKQTSIQQSGDIATALILTLLGLGLTSARFYTRPEVFSYLFLPLTIILLEKWKEEKKSIWLLVPLFCLWANLHVGFFMGIAVVAAYALGMTLEYPRLPKSWSPLWLGLLLAVTGSMLTPNLWHIYSYPLTWASRSSYLLNIDELRPPWSVELLGSTFQPFLLLIVITGIIALLWNFPRVKWSLLLPFTVLTFAAFNAMRNIGYLGVAAPLLMPVLRRNYATYASKTRLLPIVILGILGIFYAFGSYSNWWEPIRGENRKPGLGLRPHIFPLAAVRFLDEEKLPNNIFNNQAYGNLIVWESQTQRKVFIDARLDIAPEEFFRQEFIPTVRGELGWEDELARWQINTVILPPDPPGETWLNGRLAEVHEWALVWNDDLCLIWVRRGKMPANWIQNHEYIIFKPNTPYFATLNQAGRERMRQELERAITANPEDTVVATIGLAALDGVEGHANRAVVQLEELLKQRPELDGARWNLALAYRDLGEKEKALTTLQQIKRTGAYGERSQTLIQILSTNKQ